MKKLLISLVVFAVLLCSLSMSAFADAKTGYVTFTPAAKMDEVNFKVDQVFEGLQPGDSASYTVVIKNTHPQTTRWYMKNEVLSSLEQSAAAGRIAGGAYDYILKYKGPSGTVTTLFDSTSTDYSSTFVGGSKTGTDKIGLNEATETLKDDYFFLDTLNTNESGTVTLEVYLEGETQGNTYQNTAAEIKMNFAVELVNNSTTTRTAVKTGDENNLVPYYIGMIVAGLLFLYLALDAFTDRLYKKGKG